MIKIWFEPHSTTIDNEASRASGWNDVDLSELGIQQAQDMIERNLGRKLEAIFCSDLQRALKTGVPTANQLHIPLYVDERLRECDYGDLTQGPKDQIDSQRVQRIHEPFPNGESYTDCIRRMEQFLAWFAENFDGQTVLIIGHRATHYALDHLIKGEQLEACLTTKFVWQPGWEYELEQK